MRTIAMLSAVALATVSSTALGVEVKPSSVESRVTSIALFKNGLAFVTREAVLPRSGGVARLDGLPVPVHGTFWAWTPGRPDGIRRLTASLEPSTSTRPALSLADLVLANAGRELEIVLNDGKSVRGRPVASATVAEDDPLSPARSYLPVGREPILVTTSSGTVAIDPGTITRVNVEGAAAPRTELERRTPRARLDLETAGSGDDRLALVYLSRGATWAPSYSVELMGRDKARVTAKAEIVNELEDLDAAEVKLVTGYPNIAYSAVDDPIAMRGDLAAFLAALNGSASRADEYAAAAMRQNIAFDRLQERREADAPSYSTKPPAGERADELFLYPLPKFSLAKGQRAYVPLFSVDVAAEHLYELDLDDRVRDDRYAPAPPQAPLEIWHRVRLTNSGTVPWTTAPAMATRGGAIVAQDELPYSAPGGTSTLRITRVGDLHAEADEFEVERKGRALEMYGHTYDEITVRGVAEVTSLRDEDVTVTVTKSLTGEVLATTPAGKVDKTTVRLLAVNPNSVIRWALPLKARGKVKVEYRYKVLIQV